MKWTIGDQIRGGEGDKPFVITEQHRERNTFTQS